MTVSAAGSLLTPCPVPPVHVAVLAVNPPTTQSVRCLFADESSRTLLGLRILVVHFDGVRTEISTRVLACRGYGPVVYRPASVKSSSLRIAMTARIIWNVAVDGPGSLDLLRVGDLDRSALGRQAVIWTYFVDFRVFRLDAVCPWGNRFAFEFLYSNMSVVDVVLLVNGIDQGGVSRGPFYTQGRVRVGGGRAGRTFTVDCLVPVLASSIRIVGNRLCTVGYTRIVGPVCRV
jgi:hypothetical protein